MQLTRELLSSEAWRAMSPNAHRLIDFLLIEDMSHAGTENGRLMATHEQLEIHGLTRNLIRPAIDELVFLGLVRHKRGGRWAGTNQPSIFRLTFFCDRAGTPATNEWKGRTRDHVNAWKEGTRLKTAQKTVRRNSKATRRSASTVPPDLRVVMAESENAD